MRWVIKDMRSVSQEQRYNEAAMSLHELIWAQVEKFSIGTSEMQLLGCWGIFAAGVL